MRRAVQLCVGLLCGSVVWAQTTPPTYNFVQNGVQSATVDNSTGVPRLMINGQPVPPLLFFFNTQVPASVIAAGVKGLQYLAPQMQDANAAGIHIFSMGFDSWPWDAGSAANPPSFSASDQEMAQLLKTDPQAVFLLRIPVSPPANWSGWANYAQWGPNEDNLYLDGTSAPISIASNVYFQGFIAGVKLMVQHYESSSYASHILGYHIAGQNTGEWFPANYRNEGLDYSPASTAAFRSWLLQKYGTDQALSNAWGFSVTIAKAPIPVPDPGSFPIASAAQGAAVQEFYSLPSEQNMVHRWQLRLRHDSDPDGDTRHRPAVHAMDRRSHRQHQSRHAQDGHIQKRDGDLRLRAECSHHRAGEQPLCHRPLYHGGWNQLGRA